MTTGLDGALDLAFIYAFNANMFKCKDTMTMSPIQQNIWALPTGTVIRVSHGWYDHVGLIGERPIKGERSVMAFSAQA